MSRVKLTDTTEYLKVRRKKELAAIPSRLRQLEKDYWRLVASALTERGIVYPGYELAIQFRVGIDSLAQLPSGDGT